MAFYTSRMDKGGKEVERRNSARSSSVRSSLTGSSCSGNSSEKMFVNLDCYTAKSGGELSDASSLCLSALQDSMTSSSESRSDIVPPLDFESEEDFTTRRDCTFSYRKHCENAKLVLRPDHAFDTWLSAKRKVLSDEALRKKKIEEQKQQEQEERKRLADQKFQEWLKQKSRQQMRSRDAIKPQVAAREPQPKGKIGKRQTEPLSKEAQAKLDEWTRSKQAKDKQRRVIKRVEEEARRQEGEERRQMSAVAWERWVTDVEKKPKPVPLNRGIFTLRGTISDIYINPNEWEGSTEIIHDDD